MAAGEAEAVAAAPVQMAGVAADSAAAAGVAAIVMAAGGATASKTALLRRGGCVTARAMAADVAVAGCCKGLCGGGLCGGDCWCTHSSGG